MIKSIWGTASNAIASAADRLDSIGAAIKDTLAEDTSDDFLNEAEDLEEYKKMLRDLEMQQVELSKQSRLALADKEAELDMYKAKLREFMPNDANLEQSKLNFSDVSFFLSFFLFLFLLRSSFFKHSLPLFFLPRPLTSSISFPSSHISFLTTCLPLTYTDRIYISIS